MAERRLLKEQQARAAARALAALLAQQQAARAARAARARAAAAAAAAAVGRGQVRRGPEGKNPAKPGEFWCGRWALPKKKARK